MWFSMQRTWANSKESILRVDGPQFALVIEEHPGDIISHTLSLPSRH